MLAYQVTPELQLAMARPLQDAAPLFDLIAADRENLGCWLPWVVQTQTVADETAFLRLVNRHLGTGESLNLVIWVHGTIAGMISVNRFDQVNRSGDIGYWLGKPFRGQGIMTQAVVGMCDLAFEDYDLNRLVIRAAVENGPSNAVAQRAGFRLEGTLRQNEKLVDGYHDEQLYSYLKTEWLTTKGL